MLSPQSSVRQYLGFYGGSPILVFIAFFDQVFWSIFGGTPPVCASIDFDTDASVWRCTKVTTLKDFLL